MLGYKYIAQCEQYIAYGTHVLHKVIPVFVVLFSFAPIIPISIGMHASQCVSTHASTTVYILLLDTHAMLLFYSL